MKNLPFYLVLFLALGVYGVVHHRLAAKSLVRNGYVQGKGVVLSQSSEARQTWVSKKATTYDMTVDFTYSGTRHTVVVTANGAPREKDIGREINILINTQDIEKTTTGSFRKETVMGLLLALIGAAGFIVFGVLILKKIIT